MTKKELKEKAQQELVSSMQCAFDKIWSSYDINMSELSNEERHSLKDEMSKQFARVESLFGYEKNSWSRGC